VYRDFSTDAGEITMDLEQYGELFGPAPPSSMALYLDAGIDADEFVDQLKGRLPDAPLWIRSNRTLREEVFKVFDQTFAITRVLQVMALLVATCCIALTLLVQARERAGELALMAALGARPPQVFRLYLSKGVGIGALGLGLGVLAGLALARVLIDVINPAFFGWSLAFHWPAGPLTEQALTILLAAALASLYPASRASRTPATELSRDR
jgi:putative ABC transport system permease protein